MLEAEMSVPFSNTNLRIPRGFGNILEGLAREVLREQPEDIPTFAAMYFTTLLKQREESGLDPAEWGARLADRFYNNHAFKDTKYQGNSCSAKATGSTANEDKVDQVESFENEDIITHPSQRTSSSIDGPDASKDEENLEALQSNELENKLDDESGKTDPIAIPVISDVDICAEELKETEDTQEQGETSQNRTAGTADICSSELESTPLSSYRGVANVDVCAEELQTTSQEEEPADEDTEGSRDLIDVSLTRVSESPKPVLGEDFSGSQDVLDTYDKLMLSSSESPAYSKQEASKELNDTSDNKRPVALPMDEEEEIDNSSDYAQNTLSEMTDGLFEEEGENTVEQFSLNEAAESSNVPVSFETSTEEENENQESKDTLSEIEAIGESLSNLEKVSLEDSSNNANAEEHVLNIASDVQEEDNDDCVKQSEDIDEVMSTKHHQSSFKVDVQVEDKQIDFRDIDDDMSETRPDAPMEESKELMESNTSFTGTSAEEMKEVDTIMSQQSLPKVEDTTGSDDQEDNEINETEMQEDYVFDGLAIHEAKYASQSPTSEEPQENTEGIQEGHAAESQGLTAETETALDQEEQSEQNKFSQDSILKSEDKEVEDLVEKNDQQEECSNPQEEEDIMDIPLDDPEANKAAAKIQAGFRGHMTRKKLKPGDKPGEEVSSTGEALNGSQGETAGGSEGVETDDTSVPEQ